MPSHAQRGDLHHGLAELLGPERAETSMPSLPTSGMSQTGHEVRCSRPRARTVRADGALGARMASLEAAFLALGIRLDRIHVTLVDGPFVIIAAWVVVIISV